MSVSEAYDSFDAEGVDRSMLVLLHLSNFVGYVVPIAGFVLPVVLWLTMRDDSPEVDAHGREVVNWMLSIVIYIAVSVVLCMALIGIPLLILFSVLAIVFPMVGAVKASNGILWKYPLTIRFF